MNWKSGKNVTGFFRLLLLLRLFPGKTVDQSFCFLFCCLSKLKAQWDEKTKLLATLEQDMARLQQSFSQGTEALTRDRDAALEGVR